MSSIAASECMNSLIWFPRAYDEKHAQLGVVYGVVHGPGPQRWSMERVHGVVHGPGPQGWSKFCIRPGTPCENMTLHDYIMQCSFSFVCS